MNTSTKWVIWYKRAGSDRKLYVAFNQLGKPFNMSPNPSAGTHFTMAVAEYMADRFQKLDRSRVVGFEPIEEI